LKEKETLKPHAIKIDNIPRHPGSLFVTPAKAGVQKKRNNINFILDIGLAVIPDSDPGRYDDEG
jgi:hypothetical protein